VTKTIDEINEIKPGDIIKKIKPKTVQKIQDLKSALDHRYGRNDSNNISPQDYSKFFN